MAFERLKKTQQHVITLLENSIEKDRLSHAYLFVGEHGTNKFEMALYFAKKLLCTNKEETPCGTCHNCRRIDHGTHPNVYVIEPKKNTIRKRQITDLQHEFNKTSVEPGPKVYIIKNIETINASAANSLLKFLEEPHPGIYAVLTTINTKLLLPTIVSRSQVVQFHALHDSVIKQQLIEAGYPNQTANICSKLTNSLSDATAIANTDYFLDVVELVTDIYRLLNTQEESLVLYFNEKSSIIVQDKEISSLFLRVMMLYQKDIIHVQFHDKDNIVFTDELPTIESLQTMKDKNRLIDELERMLTLESRLSSYINQRLAYDNLLLSLERR